MPCHAFSLSSSPGIFSSVLSVRFTAPRTLLSPRASSRLSCGQCKGGESGPRERERISDRERTDCGQRPSDIRDARSRRRQTIHSHASDRTRMRRGFICKGVVNGRRGHGVGYRPVVSFSFCPSLSLSVSIFSNLVPLPGHHQSPPRRSRSILIYENPFAVSFPRGDRALAFSKDRSSMSLSSLPLSLLRHSRAHPFRHSFFLAPVAELWRSRGWPR